MSFASRTVSAAAVGTLVPLTMSAGLVLSAAPAHAEQCLPIPGLPIPGLTCVPDASTSDDSGVLTASTPTSIAGDPKVGQMLTATEPEWSIPGTITTYQWFRADAKIPGASSQTYMVTPDDLNRAIKVVATGSALLLFSGTSESLPVTGALGDAPTATTAPKIEGTPAVGELLTANPGTWSGEPVPTFRYQWYRGTGAGIGSKIQGETSRTYRTDTGDSGSWLTVMITADRTGYQSGSAVSDSVTIGQVSTTTKLAFDARTVEAGTRAVARISVRARNGGVSGKVQIFEGKKVLASTTLSSRDGGSKRVKLPKLRPGKHSLIAVFLGAGNFSASASKKVQITVERS